MEEEEELRVLHKEYRKAHPKPACHHQPKKIPGDMMRTQ